MSQGLLSGVLPTIFEAGNRIRRYRNALLRDPIGNANALAESLAVDINDQMQAPQWRNSLLGRPFDPMAMRQEQNKLAGLFAGVGMTKPVSKLPYQIDHKPMTVEGGAAPLHDLTRSFQDDVYSPQALQFYGSGDARERQILRMMQSLRGKPDAEVTIYRGVPQEATGINAGDWVTLSPQVAADYAMNGGKVVSMKVRAKDITSWPDSLLEFGYWPQSK